MFEWSTKRADIVNIYINIYIYTFFSICTFNRYYMNKVEIV